MRFRLTLVLLLANLVVLGAILLLEQRGERLSSDAIHRRVLPVGLVEQVEAIEVRSERSGQVWQLARENAAWWVEEPVRWPANRFAIDRLLLRLLDLRWETRFSEEEIAKSGRALGEYGLEPAHVVLTLRTPQQELRLRIGAPREMEGAHLYVQIEGQDEIAVVKHELLGSLLVDLGTLVDARVLQIHPSEARLLSVQQDGTRVRLREQQGNWLLEAPVQAPADRAAVERALESLYQMQAAEFVPADLAAQGLVDPDLRIAVESAQRIQHLLVGNPVPGEGPARRYAKLEDRDAVIIVPDEPFAPLARAQETLREKRLLPFAADQLNLIELRLDEQKTTLQKLENGTWQILFDQGQDGLQSSPADAGIMSQVITALQQLEAVSFVTDAPAEADLQRFGLPQPQRVVTLRVAGREQPLVLRLGTLAPDRNLLYAQTSLAATVYEVRPNILLALPLSPLAYRERVVQQLAPTATVQRIRLVRDRDNQVLFARELPTGQSWEALEALEQEPAASLLEVLRYQLRAFTVRNYLKRGFTRPFMLDSQTSIPWEYRLEADVTQPGSADAGTRTMVYYLSRRRGGMTQYGASPDADLVFSLPQAMIDALEPYLGPLDQATGAAALPPATPAPAVKPSAPAAPAPATPSPAPAP